MADKSNKTGKDEKKADTNTETALVTKDAAPAQQQLLPPGMEPPTSYMDKLKADFKRAKIEVPSDAEMLARLDAADASYQAFADVAEDPTLSDGTKTAVKSLLKALNPVKEGIEEDTGRWSVLRIMVCQPTTQAASKPADAKQGDLYTSAGQLVERPFAFTPLYVQYENVMFTEGEKVPTCQASDAKLGSKYGICLTCPNLPYGMQNGGRGTQQQTACQNQVVVTALSMDLRMVALITFAKTSRSAGSALVNLIRNQEFLWKQSYLLTTEKQTGTKGTYYTLKVEPTGKNCPPDVVKVGDAVHAMTGARRKVFLGEMYTRALAAPMQVAMAEEAAFTDATLLAIAQGAEPDLSATPATSATRNAARPM